ncbi:hypothetical protein [Parasitella parasitica]|uniref:CCHC-type domain-containing protein n=1 Tax=Parasitella parasitica TaxID=35722 RepID=A0A0B7NDM7_9FUNG|nr:hypothetical protein [Parasitella parasitica]
MKSNQARHCFDLGRKTAAELGELSEGGQLFIYAKDKNSIVIDGAQFTKKANINFKGLGVLLREQYPEALGLRICQATKGTQYFEINFRTAAAREEALKKDFTYKYKKSTVSRTFPKDATIIRVSISDLPYEDETILKDHMSDIFKYYGEILEMGILYTVHGHWFTGRGFVTLNQIPPGRNYNHLTPQIHSWDDNDRLALTYTNMKPSCSRCRVTDHVFDPTFSQCYYICGHSDHLQAGCPEAWWNLKKMAKKIAKRNTAHKSSTQASPTEDTTTTKESVTSADPYQVVTIEDSPTTVQQRDGFTFEVDGPSKVADDTTLIQTDLMGDNHDTQEASAPIDSPLQENNSNADHHHEERDVVSDTDMGSDVDDSDLDMSEATKEANETNVPIEQALAKRRLQLKKAKNKKQKTIKQMKGNKALGQSSFGSRPSGGVAKGQKQTTNTSSSTL